MSAQIRNYQDLVIVSGADSSHFFSLLRFLSSLYKHEPDITVIVFDLGFTEHEKQRLRSFFPQASYRTFDYSQYPDYFNIKINAGEYAWKPVIFNEVLNEYQCCVCWLDAGTVVTAPLLHIRRVLSKIGMYAPHSLGTISDWTHPKMLEFFGCGKQFLSMHNLGAGCVAVDFQNIQAREIITKWKECALTKDCIAPYGSNRQNHRQDQAALSILAHQTGITRNMPSKCLGFKFDVDIDGTSSSELLSQQEQNRIRYKLGKVLLLNGSFAAAAKLRQECGNLSLKYRLKWQFRRLQGQFKAGINTPPPLRRS